MSKMASKMEQSQLKTWVCSLQQSVVATSDEVNHSLGRR